MTDAEKKIITWSYTLDEIDRTARRILDVVPAGVWFFDAPMGSGKTTLIGQLIKHLSDEPFLGSPTFSLVNTYQTRDGGSLYHWDLYRIKDQEELLSAGFSEYLETGDYVFIEWPELAKDFVDDYVQIRLATDENQPHKRKIEITVNA